MAVIINEFEIVTDPATPGADPAQRQSPQQTPSGPAKTPTPADIAAALCYQAQRERRLRAH